jgi:hypothetical protein
METWNPTFGRHLFCDFLHGNFFETSKFVFALELIEPAIEFPLSIFTLKECKSTVEETILAQL